MSQIQLTIMYNDNSVEKFYGENFQHGERALTLNTPQGTVLAVPADKVKAYEIAKAQTEEPDSQGVMDFEVSEEDSGVEEEGSAEEEEA